jgi:DNA transformation protein
MSPPGRPKGEYRRAQHEGASLSNSPDLVAHCLELLGCLGPTRAKRMFSGHGIYADDLFVALIIADQLYLKADADSRPLFERAGCQPFNYTRKDGARAVMSYWTAPDDAMESPALMQPWARLAMTSALRAANSKRPAAPRKTAAKARATPPAKPPAKPRAKRAG